MREKAIPRRIDINNYDGSQNLFSQPSQQQFGDEIPPSQATAAPTQELSHEHVQATSTSNEPPSTQQTSTPIKPRSQPVLIDAQVTPIIFDSTNPPYEDIEDDNEISSQQSPVYNENDNDFDNGENESQIASLSTQSTSSSRRHPRSSNADIRHAIADGEQRPRHPRVEQRRRKDLAMAEIWLLQRTTHNLFMLAPFTRLVKEILTDVAPNKGIRIQKEAIQALMDISEAKLITLFESSYLCSAHARRSTLMIEDIQLVRHILSIFGHQDF